MTKLIYSMHETQHESFHDAFSALYRMVQDDLRSGHGSWHVLEAATWIQEAGARPVFWYDILDKANACGLLRDGHLVNLKTAQAHPQACA